MKKDTINWQRIETYLKGLQVSQEPGLCCFADFLQGRIDRLDRLAAAARRGGRKELEKELRSLKPPFSGAETSNYYEGRDEDQTALFLWETLFPEKFEYNPETGPTFVLREGESFGERERDIIVSLLMSPPGRALLFKNVVEYSSYRWAGECLDCPPEVSEAIGDLTGMLSICPSCGTLFIGSRNGQKYCGAACRRKEHAIPSSERWDNAPRMFFYRKLDSGFSREDAWKATLARHGDTLKDHELDGAHAPRSWAKER
jgi:hypothetical protein